MEITLDRPQIREGVYRTILQAHAPETYQPEIELVFLEKVICPVTTAEIPDRAQAWSLEAEIPANCLSDGVQTFLLNDKTSKQTVGSFTVVTGEPLDEDIRAEMELLRAELDLLKKAFRRHCSETQN